MHFIPIHVHPYYRDRYGYEQKQFPVAWREFERLISLPLHPRLSDDDVDDVIEAVQRDRHAPARCEHRPARTTVDERA